jgi:predicted heme/steroid binding protein
MAMLTVLVEAERCAVRGYTQICNLVAGKDHRTYDLALAILNEEIEHESWFSEFLGRGALRPLHAARRNVAVRLEVPEVDRARDRGRGRLGRPRPPPRPSLDPTMRRITPEELVACDGRDGAPAYIACEGVVYDVGDSFLWRRGRHQATHVAGEDLTDALAGAPHGADLLRRCPVIGILEPAPAALPEPEPAVTSEPAPAATPAGAGSDL